MALDWAFLNWGEASPGSKINIDLEAAGLNPEELLVTPFTATLLDDSTAAEARATLGAAEATSESKVIPWVADDAAKTAKGLEFSDPTGTLVYQVDVDRVYICTGVV